MNLCPSCAPDHAQPLTDTLLRAIKKPEKGRLELADASCRGLEFRITTAGNRSWSYRYRAAGSGKLQRATIGPYPEVSLAQARAQADAMRAGVALGENPSEAKRRERREASGRTFEVLANRYLTEYARRKKKSAGRDEGNLNLHVLPKWKDRDYRTIRRADVIELVEGILSDGKPVLANRVQALVSVIFSFAVDSDLIDANPCTRLRKRGEETPGERVLTDPGDSAVLAHGGGAAGDAGDRPWLAPGVADGAADWRDSRNTAGRAGAPGRPWQGRLDYTGQPNEERARPCRAAGAEGAGNHS